MCSEHSLYGALCWEEAGGGGELLCAPSLFQTEGWTPDTFHAHLIAHSRAGREGALTPSRQLLSTMRRGS